ncbi:glycosyltransferase family 4 protein [Obesumbacterium proteus]|uniref:GalNac-alpha-(1->4)-galNac-alpha-(1->3)-diNacbac-PP-undecaprenol alpha-1,4-N-acetyl-D-galactosaminyltransferase n=1 Tax=Hafnia alvei TaxID=569 RepID=A0A172X062_HAFAL|nr:glycosyltransferase [Obesumbacterium proteus]ANF30002.1 galNac-alpha-(1->4)-galNac-alpha-(1->3)-diNacbac-PP-undecaprenol alpha-1,4-N-acetyl-D-galactosaminyltransferase [Hafnia alvei]TBL73547.1 glycosyltransferase family 4 protein [Obesumbacterium proteus]
MDRFLYLNDKKNVKEDTDTKKKICFFALDMVEKGGIQRVVVELANSMKIDYEVHILTFPNSSGHIDIPYEFDKENIIVSKVCSYNKFFIFNKIKNYLLILKRIREYIQKNNISVFLSVGMGTVVWSCLAQVFLPCKYICCDHTSFLRKERWAVRGRFLSRFFADNIVVLTYQDAESWRCRKVSVIYNPSPYASEHHKILFNPEIKKRKIIALGRFVEVKGFERLLDIWYEIEKNNCYDYTLEILGEGPLEKHLKAIVCDKKMKNVSILPFRKDVANLYRESKIQVLTSYFEGLPMVLIEGQSFCLPAVSYDIPSGPSEVIKDGETGFLIKNNDQSCFVEKLTTLMKNDDILNKMALNCMTERERFSSQKILREWTSIFESK